ncbi:conserved hypothetical protein [Photorhabdus asymbiotica]|uniref:Uncharacterized protein n=1 Tax=Photorhabdus asymbiotica subsp. asymbiotica (strain ATCC 43949 / 3105-77) TaxID=553480 RepID=C7BIW7_PHOAA|nr:conserved hypothetical protein [Photorhabdus asymbiotica]
MPLISPTKFSEIHSLCKQVCAPHVLSCAPYHILEQQIPSSTYKLWKQLANFLIDSRTESGFNRCQNEAKYDY